MIIGKVMKLFKYNPICLHDSHSNGVFNIFIEEGAQEPSNLSMAKCTNKVSRFITVYFFYGSKLVVVVFFNWIRVPSCTRCFSISKISMILK